MAPQTESFGLRLSAIVLTATLAAARGPYAGGINMDNACVAQHGTSSGPARCSVGVFDWSCGPSHLGINVDRACKDTYGPIAYSVAQGGGCNDWDCYLPPLCAQDCARKWTSTSNIGTCAASDPTCICSRSTFLGDLACCTVRLCGTDDQRDTVQYAGAFCSNYLVTLPPAAPTGCAATATTAKPPSMTISSSAISPTLLTAAISSISRTASFSSVSGTLTTWLSPSTSATTISQPEAIAYDGLSTGAKAGIGAGVGVAVIIIVLAVLLWRSRKASGQRRGPVPVVTAVGRGQDNAEKNVVSSLQQQQQQQQQSPPPNCDHQQQRFSPTEMYDHAAATWKPPQELHGNAIYEAGDGAIGRR
ncbi:hypothetical protein QQS21_007011 [Conoideocrella luteorostrata]|uniref:CFEM domain-containing protein n=1 Tax=Conoideocrella luteorostrata TaxID=1105319 RepID=A0AAJ0CQY3_9HYPO|nr:hypothetical protein QQS21_007011 [Conoideocrella luteorostrata]